MKKLKIVIILISGVTCLTIFKMIPVAECMEAVYVTADYSGDAQIIRADEAVSAQENVQILQSDRLLTCPECRIDISVHDTVGIRLIGSGDYIFDRISDKEIVLSIKRGQMIINANSLLEEPAFTVKTPVATVNVGRGSFLSVVKTRLQENATMSIAVNEGALDITPAGSNEIFTIRRGQVFEMDAGSTTPSIRAIDAKEAHWFDEVDQIKIHR